MQQTGPSYDPDTGSYDHALRYFVCLLRCTSMRMSTRSKFSLDSQETLHITAFLQNPSLLKLSRNVQQRAATFELLRTLQVRKGEQITVDRRTPCHKDRQSLPAGAGVLKHSSVVWQLCHDMTRSKQLRSLVFCSIGHMSRSAREGTQIKRSKRPLSTPAPPRLQCPAWPPVHL